MKNEVIRSITANGIVAALYFLLTFISGLYLNSEQILSANTTLGKQNRTRKKFLNNIKN